MQTELSVQTYYHREIIDITSKIETLLPTKNGTINIFLQHTTAALTLSDLDTGTIDDLLMAITKLTPQAQWNHYHDPTHFPDHLWSSIIGVNLSIPFKHGELLLGTSQRVILVELNGPRERTVILTVQPTLQP